MVKGACKANKIIWQEKLFNHQICEALFLSWFIEDSSQQLTALFSPCQSSIVFHIDTGHLICSANQMTSFYMNATLGWNGSNEVIRMKRVIVNPNPWFCYASVIISCSLLNSHIIYAPGIRCGTNEYIYL